MATFDRFQWYNPFDWFGGHDEESIFKSSEENRRARERKKIADESRRIVQEAPVRTKRQYDKATEKYEGISKDYGKFDERYSDISKQIDDIIKKQDSLRRNEELDTIKQQQQQMLSLFNNIFQTQRARELERQQVADRQRDRSLETLENVQNRTDELISDIRQAPSSAAQAAARSADRVLQNQAAVAGLQGQGFTTSPQEAFSDSLRTADANLMGNTAVAARQEYEGRLGLIGNLLARKANLAQMQQAVAVGEGDQSLNYLNSLGSMQSAVGAQGLARQQFYSNILGQQAGLVGVKSGLLGARTGLLGSQAGLVGAQAGLAGRQLNVANFQNQMNRQDLQDNLAKWNAVLNTIGAATSAFGGGFGGGGQALTAAGSGLGAGLGGNIF